MSAMPKRETGVRLQLAECESARHRYFYISMALSFQVG